MDNLLLISVGIPIGMVVLAWALGNKSSNLSPILQIVNLIAIGIAILTDRIALPPIELTFFILTAITGVYVSVVARRLPEAHRFNALLWIAMAGLNLVYTSSSLLGFYFGWEIALIPSILMIWKWGNDQRANTGVRFLIYTVIGSIAMLGAMVFIYHTTGTLSWHRIHIGDQNLSGQWALFAGFFLAFAVKAPILLFHGWQSDTYNDSPVPTSMLMSAIFSKMGIFGFFKLTEITAPHILEQIAPVVVIMAVVGAIYGAAMAFAQSNFKRVIAFSSLSHVNLVIAAIFSSSQLSRTGALMFAISHVVLSLGIWWAIDILERHWGHVHLQKIPGGIANKNRWFTGLFFIIMLSAMAVPLTAGFTGEFLIIQGLIRYDLLIGTIACIPVVLTPIYLFRSYHAILYTPVSSGETAPEARLVSHLDIGLGVVIVLTIVLLGIAPSLIMSFIGSI